MLPRDGIEITPIKQYMFVDVQIKSGIQAV